MKVKKVEIYGFKSFADRTELTFKGDGIAAIVGPNGCGKTNITDAMRWVLGEQSAKSLRGVKMEDVIFKGTNTRKGLSLAEVSLYLSNENRVLPLDFEEIVITRRILKTGESLYFINNTKCRLKDITELFMDTGMGADAYSLIEQRMIDAVLSENDEERRSLFEQVAGIKKYKIRRKETISRLESTEADLVRINDIINEVEKQVISLKRQSQKAEKYKELIEEKKDIDLKIASLSITMRLDKLEPLNKKLAEIKEKIEKINNDILKNEENLQISKNKLQEIDIEQRKKQNEIDKLNQKIQKIEDNILVLSERRKNSIESIDKYKKDIEYYSEQNQKSSELIIEREGQLEIIEDYLEELNEKLAQKQNIFDEINRKANLYKNQLNNLDNEIKRYERLINEADKNFQNTKIKIENAQEKQKEFVTKIEEINKNYKTKIDKKNELEQQFNFYQTQLIEKNEYILNLKTLINNITDEIKSLKKEEEKINSDLTHYKAVHNTYQNMSKGFEGYTAGIKELFLKSNIKGLVTTLADVINGVKNNEEYILRYLQDYLEVVIIENAEILNDIANYFRGKNAGNINFISKDLSYKPSPELPNCKKVLDFIEYSTDDEQILSVLFGNTYVVENNNIELGLQLAKAYPEYKFLNTNGILFTSEGFKILTQKAHEKDSILGRRKKIEELEQKISEINILLENSQKIISLKENEKAKLEKEYNNEFDFRNNLDKQLNQIKSNISYLNTEIEGLQQQKKLIEINIENNNNQIEALKKVKDEINDKIAEYNEKLEELDEKVEEIEADAENLEREKGYIADELNKLKFEKVSQNSKKEQIITEINKIKEMTKQGGERLQHFKELLKNAENTIELANKELEFSTKEIDIQKSERKIKVEELDYILQKKREYANEVKNLEENIHNLKNIKNDLTQNQYQIELDISKIELDLSNIIKQIKEKYDEDIQTKKYDIDDLQYEVLVENLEKVDNKIKSLGAVNMLAIEEYLQEKERLDFLTKQRDDLIESKESLNQAIKKINKTAREMFIEVFEKVRKNFQEVFLYLFGGGEADLILDENSDPLEASIEIFAQPKGKKAKHISLLSGGERALTALSLLFAIYLVKPSPYCILDEVDAPLDEANVMRFLNLLRKFGENTQFIMVTHNKRSMEAADYLYGITMEETGVSKVVSVKIKDIEEKATVPTK